VCGPGENRGPRLVRVELPLLLRREGRASEGRRGRDHRENLDTNLWPELAKWQARSPFLSQAFTWTKTRIVANDHPKTWFLSARSYPKSASPEEQGKTLSGLHSKYPLFLIDESGAMPTTVLRAAEQALSTCTVGKILQAGNTFAETGCCTRRRRRSRTSGTSSDHRRPRRSEAPPRVNLEWARQQIATYGRENPWVQAYILGQFPPSSLNTLLSDDDVRAAMRGRIPRASTSGRRRGSASTSRATATIER
jgi:phage terminase large subunit